MRKTKKEIIDETTSFYLEDPSRRAINDHGDCEYLDADGRRCAVGRCLLPTAPAEKMVGVVDMDGCVYTSEGGLKTHLHEVLAPEYRGHAPQFWRDLQALHDSHGCWASAGEETPEGREMISALHEKWDNVPGEPEEATL